MRRFLSSENSALTDNRPKSDNTISDKGSVTNNGIVHQHAFDERTTMTNRAI